MTVGLLSFASTAQAASQFTLALTYESSALSAPQSFRDAMQAAANILMATVKDNITINILVGYGDWDNNLVSVPSTSAEGSDLAGDFVAYSTIRTALIAKANAATSISAANALPNPSSIDGHANPVRS